MQTSTYTWERGDMLGKGACGSVYKARHKKKGEIVAVKVLNLPSERNVAYYNRAIEMQKREIDIMKQHSYKNIVKLLNVENLIEGRRLTLTVIAMELCTGGSLYDILQEPQNARGLEEIQFCQVLFDLASAMEYLRKNNIVHRDIKPLNIMCQIDDNGKSTFKLIDFGAARHLPENLNFTSIVGTEEYLHPDIYKRGVLRDMNAATDFDECVDLWSVGVTLYHAAVGDLPFKPFAGVRQDHHTMYKMISEKPLECISATQRFENGPIVWSSTLPDNCSLSRGLQNLVVPLLKGLLSPKGEGISFEKFFEITDDIKQKIIFFVFDTTNLQIQRIYVNPNDGLVHIKEQIATLSETSAANQILLFENLEFESMGKSNILGGGDLVNASDLCNNVTAKYYPKTWLDNPIYMFGLTKPSSLTISQLNKISPMPFKLNEFSDILQIHLQELYCKKHTVSNVILCQRLIIRAAKMYQLWFDRKVGEVKDDIVRLDSLLNETGKRIELLIVFCDHIQEMKTFLNSPSSIQSTPFSKEKTTRNLESYNRQTADLKDLKSAMEEVCEFMFKNPMHWINQTFCNEEDACAERITNSLVKVRKKKKVPTATLR